MSIFPENKIPGKEPYCFCSAWFDLNIRTMSDLKNLKQEKKLCMIAIPLSITPPFHPFFFPPSPPLSLYFFPLWRVDIIRSDTSEHAHGLPSVTSRPYATSVKKALSFSHVPQPGASPLPGYIKTPLDRPKHLRSPVGPPEPITWTLLTPPTLLTKPHFTFPLTNKYIVERITEIYRLEGRGVKIEYEKK